MSHRTAIGLSVAFVFAAGSAGAATVNRSKTIMVDPSQITDNTLVNDVWWSPTITIDRVQLANGDVCVFTLNFQPGNSVDLTSAFLTYDESVHILVDGGPAPGGLPNNNADWELTLLGATDPDFSSTSFTGNATVGALTGTMAVNHETDYLSGDGSVTGLRLKLTNKNPNGWSFNQIRLGLDAASIRVSKPAPAPGTASLLALGGIIGARRRRQA